MPGGPPAVVVVVQRGSDRTVHTAGVAEVGTDVEPTLDDHMRIASVAKAFSGATALSLVDEGVLSLDDTIAERLPDLPAAWGDVTLRQLLNHTSGLPDFTDSRGVRRGGASPRSTRRRRRPSCWPSSRTSRSCSRPARSTSTPTPTTSSSALMIEAATGQQLRRRADRGGARSAGPGRHVAADRHRAARAVHPRLRRSTAERPARGRQQPRPPPAGRGRPAGSSRRRPTSTTSSAATSAVSCSATRCATSSRTCSSQPAAPSPTGPGRQLGEHGAVPLPDGVRHGLRPHREHVRLHPVRRRLAGRAALGDGVDHPAAHAEQTRARPPPCSTRPAARRQAAICHRD